MATHSSILAWKIPWTEEPGGLPSMGSHRVGHEWSDLAEAAAFLFMAITPLYRYSMICVSIYLLVDIWVVFNFWKLICTVQLWEYVCKHVFESLFSILWGIYLVGKKVHLDFSVTWYGKTWTDFLAHPIPREEIARSYGNFQGKPFSITVIQVCLPTTNTEEAEVEWFYEYLQDLLRTNNSNKKDVIFIIGNWNEK